MSESVESRNPKKKKVGQGVQYEASKGSGIWRGPARWVEVRGAKGRPGRRNEVIGVEPGARRAVRQGTSRKAGRGDRGRTGR